MSNSSYISDLIVASQIFSTYTTYINVGLGFIGNILNILIFTNLKIFHLNRCAFYLIVESVVDIGQLIQLFIYQVWESSINGVDPTSVSLIWCKVRASVPQWCRLMLASIVCFAAIDQYLSTNPVPYRRQWSSLKLAHRQIYFAGCLCLLHTIAFAVFSKIYPILGCIVANTTLTNYYSYFFYPVLNGLLPIFISSLFSLLAYRNVRRIVRRQIPIDRRRLDQQLTAMIFVRVIAFVLFLLPYTIHRIIVLNVSAIPENTTIYVTNLWVRAIATTLIYSNHAVIFFLFVNASLILRGPNESTLQFSCSIA
jgi:hypothetical protein